MRLRSESPFSDIATRRSDTASLPGERLGVAIEGEWMRRSAISRGGRINGLLGLMVSGGRADNVAQARQAKKRGKSHSPDEA